jgi:Chitobiase/beta-hexosaminidase C-terminal domain
MIKPLRRAFFLILFSATLAAQAAVNVTTWRYDATRAGQNTAETQLNTSNVNATTFGKLYSYSVDGYVYAQPLYISALNVSGITHNVVYVATEHDSVFAFDADRSQQLWKASLLDAAHGAAAGATSVPSGDLGTNDIVPEVGITATPVIDTTTNTLYVVSKTKENGAYVHRLHALDLLTGNEKSSSPVVVQASVPGSGIGSVNGTIAFQPEWELNRTGLLLFNGHVYVAYAAHGDNGPYHGWIFSYDEATLQQTAVLNTSPNGKGNGIWHSGAALAADNVGGVPRVFFATGNFLSTGSASATPTQPYTSTQNYSNAVVRLDVTNGGLEVVDQWTPFDQQQLSSSDTDQTSGGILLLPDQGGSAIHELVQVGKNGRIEVINRDNLGGYNTSANDIVQELNGQITGLWSTPAYWNGRVYFWGSGDTLKQFTLNQGQLSSTPVAKSSATSSFPGVSPVISSNGTSAGIVWAVRSDGYSSSNPAILYAFDATNVGTHLYDSTQNAARDGAGKAVKFVVPVVTNGKVYVGTQGEVDVYGLLTSATQTVPTPTLSPTPGVFATAQNVSIADSLGGAAIYYTTDGTVPTVNSTRYTGAFTISATSTAHAIGIASGYNSSSVASGTYTIGSAPAINFSNGFASVTGLTLNGSAVNSDDSRLQLTTGAQNQAGSFFSSAEVNVQAFTTDFTFQLSGTPPIGDGITFTIQANSPTALGPDGGGLGYGPDQVNGGGGIPKSVAVKFDLYNNAGEGADSTGIYVNGASPTVPAINLTSSGIVLSSGDTLSAHLVYDGKNLSLTIKDPVSGAVYSGTFAINIPQTIGNTTAYVGFTGGSGGVIASQKILTWTYTPTTAGATSTPPTATTSVFQSNAEQGQSSGPTLRTFTWSGFPDGVGSILDAAKVGDSVTYTVSLAAAGTYDLRVTAKTFPTRGIWQAYLDGVAVGAAQDEYSSNTNGTYATYDLGSVVIKASGNHTLKFVVTGHNAASSGYSMSFDNFQFNVP